MQDHCFAKMTHHEHFDLWSLAAYEMVMFPSQVQAVSFLIHSEICSLYCQCCSL
uniref:Uncharacterized protein n=1 Tax=Arundo donax TaxID=35708 RepID=A0A0A9E4V1_ARUDO